MRKKPTPKHKLHIIATTERPSNTSEVYKTAKKLLKGKSKVPRVVLMAEGFENLDMAVQRSRGKKLARDLRALALEKNAAIAYSIPEINRFWVNGGHDLPKRIVNTGYLIHPHEGEPGYHAYSKASHQITDPNEAPHRGILVEHPSQKGKFIRYHLTKMDNDYLNLLHEKDYPLAFKRVIALANRQKQFPSTKLGEQNVEMRVCRDISSFMFEPHKLKSKVAPDVMVVPSLGLNLGSEMISDIRSRLSDNGVAVMSGASYDGIRLIGKNLEGIATLRKGNSVDLGDVKITHHGSKIPFLY